MKKLLTCLIVLLLLVGCCLIAAFPTSASDINYDDWDIIDGVIIEYIGEGGDIIVPSVDADGNPVTHIDSRAFRMNKDITSVVISEGIETMGDEVFEYCENLVEVSLPYSLVETGYSVFRFANLYALTIPGNLKIIRSDFSVGGAITDLVISDGVEELFSDCLYGAFEKLVLPESVFSARGMFRGGMGVGVKKWELYILNSDCELGSLTAKSQWYEAWGSVAPLTYGYDGCKCEIRVYASKEATEIKEYVNTYMKDNTKLGSVTTRFIGIDQEEIDEIAAENTAASIKKPANNPGQNGNGGSDNGDNGTGDNGTGDNGNNGLDINGGNNGSNNSGTNNGVNNGANGGVMQTQGSDNMLLIVLIIAVVIIVIVIGVVVCVVVLSGNKKKKKKKKVAAPVVEEIADEEKGEEE